MDVLCPRKKNQRNLNKKEDNKKTKERNKKEQIEN